jgi:hypothetical protein
MSIASAFAEKKRRDTIVSAFKRLNRAFSESLVLSRREIFGGPENEHWESPTLRALRKLGFIEMIGNGRYKVLKPIPQENDWMLEMFQTPWKGDGKGDAAWIIPEVSPDESASETVPQESESAPESSQMELPTDPVALLLAIPAAVHRIEQRMTLIEHRLMDIFEKVERLHNEWIGS